MQSLAAVAPLADTPAVQASGFSWVNLLILLVVAAVAWPLWQYMRRRLSEQRKARWAQDEADTPYFTPENDPDLRRDPPREPDPDSRQGPD